MRRKLTLLRGARRRSAPVDEPGDRTYTIWGLVTAFVLLGLIGLGWLLFATSDPPTVQLHPPQTLPEDGPTSTTANTTANTTTTAAATPKGEETSPTLPDGSPAPDGVRDVTVSDGTISMTFGPPAGTTDADLAGRETVIPPIDVTPTPDGSGLVVTVGCARSAEEFLAQVTVTEAESAVTVAAAVLVPPGAGPCGDATSTSVSVPLTDPLGSRQIVVVPAGASVAPSAPR